MLHSAQPSKCHLVEESAVVGRIGAGGKLKTFYGAVVEVAKQHLETSFHNPTQPVLSR
jgi:hypothetical protein